MGQTTPNPTLVRISELARLAGVPAPTIKHYMREGLLPRPRFRTSRNMAYYDAALADRVRAIKTLQQTRFLPLRVIDQVLEPAPSAELRSDLTAAQRAELGLAPAEEMAPVSDDASPLEPEVVGDQVDLERLVQAGLLDSTDGPLGRRERELVSAVAQARAEGFDALASERVLHRYAKAVRSFVAAELALLQAFADQDADPRRAPASIRRATRITEKLLLGLRDRIIADEIQGMLRPPRRVVRKADSTPVAQRL